MQKLDTPKKSRTSRMLPNWKNTNSVNAKHNWDPNEVTIPGYENPSNTKESVQINQPKNEHSKDESNMQWLRRQLGF